MDLLYNAFSFDVKLAVLDFLRVGLAFALAVPIGWERHQSERNLGLRTFPIVSMSACGFMLILNNLSDSNAETHARLIQGLISGIGFIGGGAILKHGTDVKGLATASSIWCSGGHWRRGRFRAHGNSDRSQPDYISCLAAADSGGVH